MSVSPHRVFISYAHESESHNSHVAELCGQLRQSGLDAWIDQYEPFPPQGWPQWMHRQVKQAQFVLVVCSQSYYRRFEGEEPRATGMGAKWEGAIITQALYDGECENRKFIPVLFGDQDHEFIPTVLRPYTYFNLAEASQKESLYRLLTDQPSIVPPPIGTR